MKKILLLLVALQASGTLSRRSFHLGRSKGGNLGAPGPGLSSIKHEELPPAQWFQQKLDHFTPNTRTWKQRYFVNDSFYDFNNPGPVFLMIGGEGPANPAWMVQGSWIDYAKKFNALCLNLEHRYYGDSHPTDDLSTKNLLYLSSQQALADLANFITAMNDKYKFNHNVKWVAFGGSYPGSLAAWLRLKYPHLVYAAVSSSGPLLAKLNFFEYFKVVVHALREKTGSEECVDVLKTAHAQIERFMRTKPHVIEKEFRVCKPFANAAKNDIDNFYELLADDFASVVQYNEDNRIGANETTKNITINTICDILTAPGPKPAYKKLAMFHSLMLDSYKSPCLDYSYENLIQEMRNVTYVGAEGGRQWMYQTCTEFGFYQTSSAEAEVFGPRFGADFYTQQCQDVFGKKFNDTFIESAVEWTNTAYGALDIPVTRVVFVHGTIDPWHALGITVTKDNDAPAILIHGTAHCANMYPPSSKDLPGLAMARVEIQEYLRTWLDTPFSSHASFHRHRGPHVHNWAYDNIVGFTKYTSSLSTPLTIN